MTTLNIDSRHVVYPHFHDTQSNRRSNKEIEIDNSVYHLLSLYLNADNLPTTTTTTTKKYTSPYWRTTNKRTTLKQTRKSWLGEEEKSKQSKQDILLERNTIQNSCIMYDGMMTTKNKNKKSRSKSVSFNETVTVISSQDNSKMAQVIKKEDAIVVEEDVFVDALENLVVE